jgi:hyperosmotically inducible protein
MHRSRILGVFVCASVAIVVAPTYVIAQSTTDKMEQKAKGAAQDAKTAISDSWLTAKTKIALFADDRIKGGQVSVETVNGAVSLRGKVDSDDAKAAAVSVAQAVEGVKSVRNDLQVVPPGDRKVIDISDKDITRQVEGRLSKDAQLKKVDVRTDGGAVILTGAVSSIGASARASELARGVPGVRMVKNELTYDASKRDGAGMRPAGSPQAARGQDVQAARGQDVQAARGQDAQAARTEKYAQVIAMQQALKDKGFDPGGTDGVMGPRTAAALKAYQKSENLPTTGTMDSDTGAKLGVKVSTEGR